MRLVIMQPSYLPWLGYFDLFLNADLFVVYDNVQFDKDGWRNRNRIKTANGLQWLTVPVLTKGQDRPTNKEVRIDNKESWARKHLNSLKMSYSKAPYFQEIFPLLEPVYQRPWEFLIDLNMECLRRVCDRLKITTPIKFASELNLNLSEDKNEKLVQMCEYFKAKEFYEPQAGKNYMDISLFEGRGIKVIFQDYQHPIYPQLYGPFAPQLSIVDLLFNCGKESLTYLQSSIKK